MKKGEDMDDVSWVIRCGYALLTGWSLIPIRSDGGEHTQDRRCVFSQGVSVETYMDIAIHGRMSRGCEKGRREEQRRDGYGDSWLRWGLHWQNAMAHHDKILADNRTK